MTEDIQSEILWCDREILEMKNIVMKDERWMLGLGDWFWERRAIEMEQLVKDAIRTDLTPEEYEKALKRIDVRVLRLLHVGMGLCTEAGEFVDQLKRHIFYGRPIDRTNLIEES